MTDVQGTCDERFEGVRAALASNLESGAVEVEHVDPLGEHDVAGRGDQRRELGRLREP